MLADSELHLHGFACLDVRHSTILGALGADPLQLIIKLLLISASHLLTFSLRQHDEEILRLSILTLLLAVVIPVLSEPRSLLPFFPEL